MEQTQEQIQQEHIQPTITDGQTDNLPPLQQLPLDPLPQTQTNQTISVSAASDQAFLYTPDEFYAQFKSVFQFAGDTLSVQSLPISEKEEFGARATSNRIYEMAQKYKFLNFLIDKRSTRLGETILIVQFLTSKAGAVYYEKRKKKLGGAVWEKAKKILGKQNKAKDTAYLAQADAAKQQKQENLSATATV